MMTPKTLLSVVCLFVLSTIVATAQTTKYPYVESQYQSQYGSTNVIGVLVNDNNTIILLEDCTPRGFSGLWISFSDNTILTYPGKSLRIISWGYWDGEGVIKKEFNTRYDLQADRRYHFVLVFPKIPSSVNKITVKENIRGGFYWNGIHLNSDVSSQDFNKQFGNNGSRNSEGGSNPYTGVQSEEYFNPSSSGTCFAINSQGYLATCYHVIEDARKIKVRGVYGDFSRLYDAEVVVVDMKNDLAILKISDSMFTGTLNIPYKISDKISDVGEDVFVLGYPLRAVMGDEIKLTNGIISSKSGYLGDTTSYQTSATVQPGNSGGPLFDSNGNVIGVINARLAVESASYAVKTPYLKMLSESSDVTVPLSLNNSLSDKSLKEKVKAINKYIYIIEVE